MASSSYHLNVLLDRELHAALQAHANASGLSISQVTRDLLRHSLGVVSSTRDAGWREGYLACYRAVREQVSRALAEITPTPPELSGMPGEASKDDASEA